MTQDGHRGLVVSGIIPWCPTVWDGHLGLSPSWWYSGIIPWCPTCTTWYNGMGWTLGIELLLVVQWGCPTVPHGTIVRDGHLGLSPSWWYSGIIPCCPTCTTWYNGTGWTLGIESLLVVQWDYPMVSYLYHIIQWYGMDTWDWWYSGIIPWCPTVPHGTIVRDGHLALSSSWWYSGVVLPYHMVQ